MSQRLLHLEDFDFIEVKTYVRRRRKFRSKVPALAWKMAAAAALEVETMAAAARQALGLRPPACPVCGQGAACS